MVETDTPYLPPQAHRDEPTGYLLDQVRVQSWQRYRREQIAAMEKEEVMISLMSEIRIGNFDVVESGHHGLKP